MLLLTNKELACLQWAAVGKTSHEAGAIMSISPRTVDYHIYNACGKLGVHNRLVAVVMALQMGLLPDVPKFLPRLPKIDPDEDPDEDPAPAPAGIH